MTLQPARRHSGGTASMHTLLATAAVAVPWLLLLLQLPYSVRATDEQCAFTYAYGVYDLNQIVAPADGFTVDGSLALGTGSLYNYAFAVCDALPTCNGEADAAAVCQYSGTDNALETNVASEDSMVLVATDNYVLLTYAKVNSWTTTMKISCSMTATDAASMNIVAADSTSNGKQTVSIQMDSVYACANQTRTADDNASVGGDGLSAGSVLLILIAVGTVVYCAVGVMFNVVQHERTGIAAVPNLGFWMGLTELTVLGVKYTVARVKGGAVGDTAVYTQL